MKSFWRRRTNGRVAVFVPEWEQEQWKLTISFLKAIGFQVDEIFFEGDFFCDAKVIIGDYDLCIGWWKEVLPTFPPNSPIFRIPHVICIDNVMKKNAVEKEFYKNFPFPENFFFHNHFGLSQLKDKLEYFLEK